MGRSAANAPLARVVWCGARGARISVQTMNRRDIRRLAVTGLVLIWVSRAEAEDTVWLASEGGTGRVKLTGRILDYTGRQLRLELSGGRQQDYPAALVRGIETAYGAQQVEAQEAYDRRQFESALQSFRKAMESETRPWVRRQIAAKVVSCYQALGQGQPAAETFLLLVRSDPDTPDFACIPLAWMPKDSVAMVEQAARQWMGRDDLPAAVLLGASHLLSGNQRTAAVARLEQLSNSADARLALLAQSQLWRAHLMTVNPAQVEQWQATLEKLPEDLRAGPYFVIGQARARLQQWDQAATAFLRVPILYGQQRPLAAAALVEAAGCLDRLNRRPEAVGLYREAAEKYGETSAGAEARARLEELRRQQP